MTPLPDRLRNLFAARRACVRIVTHDEPDARDAAMQAAMALELEPWTWSATRGLRIGHVAGDPVPDTVKAAGALHYALLHAADKVLLITLDLADHLTDPIACRALRELIEAFDHRLGAPNRAHIAMIDHREDVPGPIGAASTLIRPTLPDDDEIELILKRTLRDMHREAPIDAQVAPAVFRAAVENLRGLSRRQIRNLVAEAVAIDRVFSAEDLDVIVRGKRELLAGLGVLSPVETPASLDDIGGLARLKKWVRARERSFTPFASDSGITPPRGALLLGVQGSGKSLAAKAIAAAWKRPLLRLDPGALYDRYVGESERRLREALLQAEAMAPAVLWIDEIEKGFASAASRSVDGGLSQRMFGALLTWMQEHRASVFIVATANDIDALPPELLRKGRFDEIFFVDLPTAEARRRIFEIHLRKRRQVPSRFDLDALVAATDGYSGAEIEQGILAAMQEAFAIGDTLDTPRLLSQLGASPPLSVQQHERVSAFRAWARSRYAPAD